MASPPSLARPTRRHHNRGSASTPVHAGEWRKNNPTQGDILNQLIERYRTPARWAKAVQHLREDGKITDTPKDIGLLIKEIGDDVERECAAEIRDILFAHFWPDIRRGLMRGMPEWYKEQVMILSFQGEDQ